MAGVTFEPGGQRGEAQPGESVFEVARRLEVAVETSCVGQGTCGLCRVKVIGGETLLSPYTEVEEKHLGNVYWLTKVRLSCQARLTGDGEVVVELAPKRQSQSQSKKK